MMMPVRAHTGGFDGMLRYAALGFAVALVLAVLIYAGQRRTDKQPG